MILPSLRYQIKYLISIAILQRVCHHPISIYTGGVMKVIRCSDAGFECNHVIRAESTDEAIRLTADHAKEVHGLKTIDEATAQKIKSIMREE